MLNKRQQTLLSYIREKGEAKNGELQLLTAGCSAMTLWRDLDKLEGEGLILRFRGGAAAVSSGTDGDEREINFLQRARENVGPKKSIGALAAGLLRPEQTYYLDAGSTVDTMLRFLPSGNFNFITSAANIAAELAVHMNYDVTMLGGQLNSNTISCSGPQAELMLREINIDIAVMATSGYSETTSFTSGRLAEAALKRQVIRKAAFAMILLDHGKLERRFPFTFASLEDFGLVIGDESLPESFRKRCADRGIPLFTPDDGLSFKERQDIYLSLLNKKVGRIKPPSA